VGGRVIVRDIAEMTNDPLYIHKIIFNYNLKRFAIHAALEMSPPTIVYMDADCFLFGWDESLYKYYNQKNSTAFHCRVRNTLGAICTEDENFAIKAKELGATEAQMACLMTIECTMIITTEDNFKVQQCLEMWDKYAKRSLENECHPSMEAIELGMSLQESHIDVVPIIYGDPFNDIFRTLHNDKIHQPFIV
jgi:hypothetical protein